jgi:Transposase DDE domain
VRAADTVPKTSRGWDNAKKVNGRKRHIAVDTTGLVLDVVITPASVQDRQGARPLLWNTHRACRGVRLLNLAGRLPLHPAAGDFRQLSAHAASMTLVTLAGGAAAGGLLASVRAARFRRPPGRSRRGSGQPGLTPGAARSA